MRAMLAAPNMECASGELLGSNRCVAFVHRLTHQNEETTMFRRITCAGLPLTSLCFALIASATQAVAQQAPAIHIGSDTRAKSAGQCMNDAKFAITETGLQVSFTSGPHIAGAGTLGGAGVAVVVTSTRNSVAYVVAGGLGFEPRLTESESAVLPLNYPPRTLLSQRLIGSLSPAGAAWPQRKREYNAPRGRSARLI